MALPRCRDDTQGNKRYVAFTRYETSGRQLTPSFFCRLDDDVVYWNVSFLSG